MALSLLPTLAFAVTIWLAARTGMTKKIPSNQIIAWRNKKCL